MLKRMPVFSSRNRRVECVMCGKLTHSNMDGYMDLNMCRACREESEALNEHGDHNEPVEGCRFCAEGA